MGKVWEYEKIIKAFISESLDLSISMAGAEGFEPSTNSFGDHYKKYLKSIYESNIKKIEF